MDMLNKNKIKSPKQETIEFYKLFKNEEGNIKQYNKYLNHYNNMNLLELFSGTGSVGLIAKSLGFNVISLELKQC